MSSTSEDSGRRWPLAIALGLLIVVVVNAIFIYVAVAGSDGVVPSYATEPR